jgi:hypothetical protein
MHVIKQLAMKLQTHHDGQKVQKPAKIIGGNKDVVLAFLHPIHTHRTRLTIFQAKATQNQKGKKLKGAAAIRLEVSCTTPEALMYRV